MKKQWLAPAKLNIFLYITGRRADGYHFLQTLFYFLDYSDLITITPTCDSRIRLLNTIDGIEEKDNLIIRAAKLLQHYCWSVGDPSAPGADIELKKNYQ
ncbi:hypothetical protein A35E_00073 [secondary endosymbiont of Heteropsylla cubana]|uniref:4-(Cytidine 5'-diphospho)-2-C-methyl-D-erythritol kinase n=1 Tax=secondary endosymbiont of Heteropsylla cubana TaxID=134287 RepID=J3TYG3_9ENTR|nr:hypothetical protein A35E_00073 [secondary endosymbiont of Heteropsylla cubana]